MRLSPPRNLSEAYSAPTLGRLVSARTCPPPDLNRLVTMPTDPKEALRASVVAAQERYETEAEAARQARRDAFAKAQQKGLSLREIAELVGLDHSRIRQIIRGE